MEILSSLDSCGVRELAQTADLSSRGTLVSCDSAVKQVPVWRNDQLAPADQFIVADLDAGHLISRRPRSTPSRASSSLSSNETPTTLERTNEGGTLACWFPLSRRLSTPTRPSTQPWLSDKCTSSPFYWTQSSGLPSAELLLIWKLPC